MGKPIDSLLHRRDLRRWRNAARGAETMNVGALRGLRRRARELAAEINNLLHVADGRLALPATGQATIEKPLHCDWAYRPQAWRGPLPTPGLASVGSNVSYGDELKVFHDCERSELTLRQIRNSGPSDLAPYGLTMDVFRFDGSFLSLVIELPGDAVKGLERRHMIRLALQAEAERPVEIFARLNVKSGPNVDQVLREVSLEGAGEPVVDFDLATTNINEKRIEKMWVDLIFEGAEMNRIVLRDAALTRRPRAEI